MGGTAVVPKAVSSQLSLFTCAYYLFVVAGVLSRLKIACLENEKREAKQKYNDSLKVYVQEMLGRPMEKLNVSRSLRLEHYITFIG